MQSTTLLDIKILRSAENYLLLSVHIHTSFYDELFECAFIRVMNVVTPTSLPRGNVDRSIVMHLRQAHICVYTCNKNPVYVDDALGWKEMLGL